MSETPVSNARLVSHHLSFQELSKGVGIWNELPEVSVQKQVGSCEHLNFYASVCHRAILPTISSSSSKAHQNQTALYTSISHFSSPSESHLSSRHCSYSFYFRLFNALPHSRYSWAPLKPLQIQYQHPRSNSCSVSLFLPQSASLGCLITDTESSDF